MPAAPTPAKIAKAIAAAAAERSFEKRGDAWYSITVATNSGSGSDDEQEALRHHHKMIGFDALKRLGFDDDETHEFDWHRWPMDSAEAFVAAGVAAWAEVLEARAHTAPFDALVRAMCGRA